MFIRQLDYLGPSFELKKKKKSAEIKKLIFQLPSHQYRLFNKKQSLVQRKRAIRSLAVPVINTCVFRKILGTNFLI